MNAVGLQDRIARAEGIAARRLGEMADVFRPRGATAPLDIRNRLLRLPVEYIPESRTASPEARALWRAVIDSVYVQPSDYLVGVRGIFFVAFQAPFQPVIVIRTNSTISLARAAAPAAAGVNEYGGVTRTSLDILLAGWPACLLNGDAVSKGVLPGDPGLGSAAILLPALPVVPKVADLLTDDLGRCWAVVAAGRTEAGWRLAARQAAT